MPWLKEQWGVAAATILMVGLSMGALFFFKWTGWL